MEEQRIQLQVLCPICLSLPSIPVQVVGFPCHCMSFHRVCIGCARKWLHLDKSQTHREHDKVACLFCSSTLPSNMSENDLLRVDGLLLSQCRLECPCGHKSTDGSMMRHLEDECLLVCTPCRHCHEDMPKKEFVSNRHIAKCPCYVKCSMPDCRCYWTKDVATNRYKENVKNHLLQHIQDLTTQIDKLRVQRNQCKRQLKPLLKS